MLEKKQVYESLISGLPSLNLRLGEMPDEESDDETPRPLRPFVAEKSECEVKGTVNKLIGHLRKSDW